MKVQPIESPFPRIAPPCLDVQLMNIELYAFVVPLSAPPNAFVALQLVNTHDSTLESILGTVYNTFLFKTPCFSPYWFFWMILGTYLIMPIFNKWLLHSDLKEVEYFLIIWVISTIFDYTLMKSCPVNLSYFTSPIGVVVLGYYFKTY